MSRSITIGVDIGGSHITAALIDLNSKTLLRETITRKHIHANEAVPVIITEWGNAIKEANSGKTGPDMRIGMALPGPFDYDNGISYIRGLDKYDSLYGVNVKDLLSRELGIPATNIRMKNDAGCFLQGEILSGAAVEVDQCIGLTIGTGIGTAVAKKGIAEDAARWQSPFGDSIAENYFSTRWFVKRYRELFNQEVKDVRALTALIADNPSIQLIFDEFADNFANFLRTFVEDENPELIVLGGNISHAEEFFLPRVKAGLKFHGINIPIRKSTLGEHAALIGSAALWAKPISQNHNTFIL